MSVMKSDTFDVDLFETRLESLKDTQEGIQQMSSWCLQQRVHHKKIVASWLNVLKRVRVEHRLCLFYLANDVIQYSKRKRYEFVESWATALQRATTMVRDERVKSKILRIFHIWEQREVYSDEFISDLHGLLNINPPKKVQAPVEQTTDDYQNTTLITNVRECVELSNATDLSFKKLPRAPNCDIENIKQQLKDKSHSEDVEKEIERYMAYIEAYNKNLQSEIRSRKAVLNSLDTAIKFYSNQRGEVKVVVGAYKNFGSRIKLVKKKLDEIIPNLPSPIPSPDINAPSPEPDTDLQLPDEQHSSISVNMFKGPINGYSSYLDGNLPFDINDFKRDENKVNSSTSSTASQPIEVIATRPDDTANDSFNSSVEYYKPESISAYPGGSSVEIPGLSPMPVPPVQSEYTSLARAANQYGIIQAPHPPTFGNASLNRGYSPLITTYNDNSYHSNVGSGIAAGGGGGGNGMPLMPPPMPPSLIGGPSGNGSVSQNADDDFNSWDMNMSWTQLDSATASASSSFNASDTVISPAFDRKIPGVDDNGRVGYGDIGNSLGSAQDVDHRQLHLTSVAASIGIKLGLSKEKSRQLDIDHRNLISLTGSPSANEDVTSKKSWLSSEDKDLRTNDLFATGDVDYRSGVGLGQAIQTIDTITAPQASSVGSMQPPPLPPGFLGFGSMRSPNNVLSKSNETVSPKNSNNTSVNVEDNADNSCVSSGYDPSDMVVDMDMSDEDLDDIFREVTEEQGSQEQLELSQTSSGTDTSIALSQQQQKQRALPENAENEEDHQHADGNTNSMRPPLLETPPEYVPQNSLWDQAPGHNAPLNPFHPPGIGMDNMQGEQQQQQNDNWNQPMSGFMGGGGGGGPMFPPPPPQPPFQMHPQQMQEQPPHFPQHPQHPQQYGPGPQFMGGGEHAVGHMGRGRGRGWVHSSPNPFRNAQRPPRGGGSPYFNNRGGRGVGGPGMRGLFRGKFRGNNSWI